MTVASTTSVNVKQAVPFFGVTNMEGSLRFYVDGLGFAPPKETLGTGTSVCFMCEDALALYREFKSHGIQTRQRPFVGNRLWVVPLTDPDGYRIDFESPTDAPEESELAE